MPGMRFTIGIIRYLNAKPALRTTLVPVAPPGDTAYTAMPEGSRRASTAVHQAMMSFASAYVLLGTYFTFGQWSLQGRALDVLHHQVVWPDIVQGADVGMVQGRDRVRFALEALGELLVGNLDGDGAIQPRIASFVDLAHAARADGRDDLIGSQPSSSRQGHKIERLYRAAWG